MSRTFATTARLQVRAALELAVRRSPETAARISADLAELAAGAASQGLAAVSDLARRAAELAKVIDRDAAALTACVRALRELGRALEVAERTARPRGKVLIVDDSPLNAEVVRDALERAGFNAQYAEDGNAAAAAVAATTPDVVLTDVHMPDSTPGELCARIRAAAGTSPPPRVLLFSGLSDRELEALVEQTHADGFLSKDHGLDAIVEGVARAYRRSE